MTLKDELPHDPEAAHALIRQKLNEHTDAINEVRKENEEQNINIVKLTIDTIARLMKEEPRYRSVLKTSVENINYDLITYVGDRLGHDMRYAIDPSKTARELGWYPETPFEVGIEKTIRWYLEHQEWVEEVVSGDYQKYYEQMYSNR